MTQSSRRPVIARTLLLALALSATRGVGADPLPPGKPAPPLAQARSAIDVAPAARALHEQLLTLDTHLDTPALFPVRGWSVADRHDRTADGSHVDIPRLIEGGLDGGFWVIYTPQGPRTQEGARAARDFALERALVIREVIAENPKQLELARSAADAARIAQSGKRVVFLSIENGSPFEWDPSLLAFFYKLGVRLAGPVHFANNGLADSSTDKGGAEWHGLSAAGRAFVAEANRLGIVLDASHASDDVLDQLLVLSKTPVVLSHSGVKAVFNHPRNIDDERLRRLAKQGGVIQINFMSAYLLQVPSIPEREAALAALRKTAKPEGATLAERKTWVARQQEIDRRWPVPRATFEDGIRHLLHAIRVAGIDHVGIGADFDGGGGVTGFEDARDYPKITARLLAEGFSREDIQKVWSGNVLRALAAAEAYAQKSQGSAAVPGAAPPTAPAAYAPPRP